MNHCQGLCCVDGNRQCISGDYATQWKYGDRDKFTQRVKLDTFHTIKLFHNITKTVTPFGCSCIL